MPTVWVAGVDLEVEYGFQLTDEGSVLDAATLVPAEIVLPTVVGAYFAGPGQVGVREFVLTGYVAGSTFAGTRQRLERLTDLTQLGEVTIRLADRATMMIRGTVVAVRAVNMRPQFLQTRVDVAIVVRAAVPYWREVMALSTRLGTLAAPEPMPMGSASVAPDYWLFGPVTNPVLKGYDYMGNELWASTLTIALGANDALRLRSSAFDMTIWKYIASATGVQDDTLLVSGSGVFPRPLHANRSSFQFSQWPLVGTSAPSGVAVYPRMWV